ncbi:chaoptin-like [Aphidius gifuensis]|uniref:chaoptin-like n=1 Tax=Aphidius gifuensis TaxID=684658 RepID=UPI001CDC2822|nr:chaoptin-like [Aphidius gifuensis]
MLAKNLLMMPANSIAGVLMFTIGLSLINLGSSRISSNQMSSENITSLPPVEMMNSTISTITPNMPNEWSNNTGTVDPSSQSQNKLETHLAVSSLLGDGKFKSNFSQRRQDNIKEKDYNLFSELSIGILKLSADLHQKQEAILKITQDYNTLNYKYMELEKSYSIDKQKIEKINNKVEILQLNIRDKENDLDIEKKNNKVLFDSKTLCDNELLTTRLENEELHNKLVKLNDTLKTVSQDQENLGKTLEIAKLDSEKKEKNLNILELKMKNIINEKNNMEVKMKIEVDQLNDKNKKLVGVQTENIKTIENECQSNLTNKQQEIKMMKNDIFKKSLVKLADLSNTLTSIMKFDEDNVPDDLLEKRRRLLQNQYDENQTEVVNYIRKLFDDIALTSNHKFPNKYFCNKKISHYDSRICALFSESSNNHRISLQRVNLSIIPKDTFADCKKVDFLDLSFNRLNYLESGTFNGLIELKELWIKENHLATLPKDIFNGLEKLEFLTLDSNRLNYLEPGTFNGLSNLNKLYIYQNKITTLPKNIFNGLEKLELLSLFSNQLNFLESGTFNGLSQLKILDIQKNHLTALSKNIFNDLKNLEKLYLNGNRLNSLESGTFNGLSNLKWLYIGENNLTTCSKHIFGLDILENLYC